MLFIACVFDICGVIVLCVVVLLFLGDCTDMLHKLGGGLRVVAFLYVISCCIHILSCCPMVTDLVLVVFSQSPSGSVMSVSLSLALYISLSHRHCRCVVGIHHELVFVIYRYRAMCIQVTTTLCVFGQNDCCLVECAGDVCFVGVCWSPSQSIRVDYTP